jgi:hypothetical protein
MFISCVQVSFQDLSRSSQTMYLALLQVNILLRTHQESDLPVATGQPAGNGHDLRDFASDPDLELADAAAPAAADVLAAGHFVAGACQREEVEPLVDILQSPPALSPSPSDGGFLLPDCVPRPGDNSGNNSDVATSRPDLLAACQQQEQLADNDGNDDIAGAYKIALVEDNSQQMRRNSPMFRSYSHLQVTNDLGKPRSRLGGQSPTEGRLLDQRSCLPVQGRLPVSKAKHGELVKDAEVAAEQTEVRDLVAFPKATECSWAHCGSGLARVLAGDPQLTAAGVPKGEKTAARNSLTAGSVLGGNVAAVLTVVGILYCAVQFKRVLS